MDGSIYVRDAEGNLVRMAEQSYDAEAVLQKLLEDHPDLLGGEQINPGSPRRWLLIGREVGIPAEEQGGDWWAVDLLFLDQDAVSTFVEVKRAADARTRCRAIARMLDYAANAQRYWPVERLREAYAHRCTEAGLDPALELSQFLDGGDVEAFWGKRGKILPAAVSASSSSRTPFHPRCERSSRS
jgi:hypothetical protein